MVVCCYFTLVFRLMTPTLTQVLFEAKKSRNPLNSEREVKERAMGFSPSTCKRLTYYSSSATSFTK